MNPNRIAQENLALAAAGIEGALCRLPQKEQIPHRRRQSAKQALEQFTNEERDIVKRIAAVCLWVVR